MVRGVVCNLIMNTMKRSIVVCFLCVIIFYSCGDKNILPYCEITSPEINEKSLCGDTLVVSIDAFDPDGTINDVFISINDTGVISCNSFPYNYYWDTKKANEGNVVIKATAIDDNNEGTSDQITIKFTSPGIPCQEEPFIVDIDENVYETVLIGNQCWMKENLMVSHYPNGSPIPFVECDQEWCELLDSERNDAYCYQNNDTSSCYGVLYTYSAAIANNWQDDNVDNQGICPDGWHIPSEYDWSVLFEYLGGEEIAGGKMKEATYSYWNRPNLDATNKSGFSGLPAGLRSYKSGIFSYKGEIAIWWSAEEHKSLESSYYLHMNSEKAIYNNSNITSGLSVRCLRNE